MTALCPGGGPSEPKPGTSERIAFTGSSVALVVEALGFPELAPAIAVIGSGVALETIPFCSTDPPPEPTITLDDIGAVLDIGNPLTFAAASQKLLNWFLHHYWYTVCQCSGGVSSPPPPPADLPRGYSTNPGLPSAGGTAPCWNVTWSDTAPPSPDGGVTVTRVDLNPRLIPTTTGAAVPAISSGLAGQLAYPVPSGATQYTLTATAHDPISAGHILEVLVVWQTDTAIGIGSLVCQLSNARPTQTVTVATTPPTATHWWALAYSQDATPISYTVEFDFFCGPAGPQDLVTVCCPPDPLVNQYLQLILQIVSNLYNTALPAQPISWRDGIRHSALVGSGSVALQDTTAIGVRADVTVLPVPPKILAGTPTFYWDMGFITPGALGVPHRGWRLVFEHQTFTLPRFADQVSYTLLAGTTIDLVELLPVTA